MAAILEKYKNLDASVWLMSIAELIIFSVNSAFFTIANIFMTKEGFLDPEIANFWTWRFAATLFFAIPFGIFIKGKRLKPLFIFDVLLFSSAALSFVYAVASKNIPFIYLSFIFMGLGDSATRILSISYILRNLPLQQHTAGIAINSATWGGSLITSGLFIAVLSWLNPQYFTEEILLKLLSGLGFGALFFVLKMSNNEVVVKAKKQKKRVTFAAYNWKYIFIASGPTMIIAVGAGLTIPFVNLFFYHSFGLDSSQFALLMMFVAILVVGSIVYVPQIKENFGYKAITITQSLAVVALFGMATTDFFNQVEGVFYLALFCFILRQPLMNISNPMTSEMTMYYVGKESQELMASLTSTIWSGSWFISSIIFRHLRAAGFSYGAIFYITVALYVVGVLAYHWLILDFEKRKAMGLIEG